MAGADFLTVKPMHPLPDPDRQPDFYDGVPLRRFIAWVVDNLVILALCLILVVITAFVGLVIWFLLVAVVGFIYRVATLAGGSATWGMRFAGIELRAADGSRFDGNLALWHTAGYTISFMFPFLQVISVVLMLTSPRGQGLTDMVLGSVALRRRSGF